MYIVPERHGVKYMLYMRIFFRRNRRLQLFFKERTAPRSADRAKVPRRYREGTAMPS